MSAANTKADRSTVLLQTHGLSKRYPGVQALDDVDFDLCAGEVHILFGENGAGKSTLISLLAGVCRPSTGVILVNGREVALPSVTAARKLGISAVFQEFSLVPTLTVAQNLCLGEEPAIGGWLQRRLIQDRAKQALEAMDFSLDPNALVSTLSRAEQQMVEIAKSQRGSLSVLILDEPTASLTTKEAGKLFDLIERLKSQGIGIVYISHRMQEIERIGDRITLLRNGRKVATLPAKTSPHDKLIGLMTGRQSQDVYPKFQSKPGEMALEVIGLSTTSGVSGSSMHARQGEIVGIAGLVGSGKSEIMRCVFGLERATSGQVRIMGRDRTNAPVGQLLREGVFYLPPDRKAEGLIMAFSAKRNIVLSMLTWESGGKTIRNLFLNRLDAPAARAAAERVELAPRNFDRPVGLLSGGNQQKVMFAKGLTSEGELYIFDEPTVGVDVGTRTSLYRLMQSLCERGAAVVVVSSDLPEIINLCHRAYVMRNGHAVGELGPDDLSETNLLNLFFEH